MGAVTYPNAEVERYIHTHLVPVQFSVVERPAMIEEFNAAWTPTLIVRDADGREYRRSFGYLDPQRFLGEMALAGLHACVHRQDASVANERSREALERTAGDPAREPEAMYFAAVAAYKASHDVARLKQGWQKLFDRYPNNDWSKKTEFIRG